jgi:hypothetical protein
LQKEFRKTLFFSKGQNEKGGWKMKKGVTVLLLATMLIGLNVSAQAANVEFSPALIRFHVAPGQAEMSNINLTASSAIGSPLTITVGSRVLGNLPATWFRPAIADFIFGPDGTASSPLQLGVAIPPDALPGLYSGAVIPETWRGGEPVFSRGLYVVIEVAPQNACAASPVFENIEITPQEIWAPSDRNVEIHISGNIQVGTNCDISNITAGYWFEDNTGSVSGEFNLDDQGNFAQDISVIVSRSGKDKDGRTYSGLLSAEDGSGKKTDLEFFVTVAHDKGN